MCPTISPILATPLATSSTPSSLFFGGPISIHSNSEHLFQKVPQCNYLLIIASQQELNLLPGHDQKAFLFWFLKFYFHVTDIIKGLDFQLLDLVSLHQLGWDRVANVG